MQARALIVTALLTCATAPLNAADFSDPDWPCIQPKVAALSVGLMWPHPMAAIKLTPEAAADVRDLADRFALRRLDLFEIAPVLDAFTERHGASEVLLGRLFAEVFDRMSSTRTAILQGIADYSRSQIALAARIDAARVEVETLLAADKPDHDRIDLLEEQLDWDERIYTDRAQSLTYVCETPVLLEKRLYAVAQMLLAAVAE